MTTTVKLAYHNKAKQIIHVDNAANGLGCDCKCVLCDEQLEARQGPIRDWHFKHHQNINCSGGQETALHQLGKQILVDNSKIAIPGHDIVSYTDAVTEKNFKTMRPDVTATFDNEQIFFEILVSHAVDSDKEKMLIDGQHKSVEINLRECITSTFEEIKSFVLDKTSNKRVIFWEKENVLVTEIEAAIEPVMQKTKKRNENWFEPILYLAIAVIIFLGLRRLLINRRRR